MWMDSQPYQHRHKECLDCLDRYGWDWDVKAVQRLSKDALVFSSLFNSIIEATSAVRTSE
jgi:hypothetical protein